jgi:hypothetical protein
MPFHRLPTGPARTRAEGPARSDVWPPLPPTWRTAQLGSHGPISPTYVRKAKDLLWTMPWRADRIASGARIRRVLYARDQLDRDGRT